MLKTFLKKAFNITGFQIHKVSNTISIQTRGVRIRRNWKSKRLVISEPLNGSYHFQYAQEAFDRKEYYLAFAELKTAEFLGINESGITEMKNKFLEAIPDARFMNHNQYFRFLTLSDALIKRTNEDESKQVKILDVGGGHGELASFIPDFDYCLAEPRINGISGEKLPFKDRSFHYVISCHVLEHIPEAEREYFLDQLLSKSRKGLILLNPFHVDSTYVKERLELIVKVTNSEWAKEHLDCTPLPKIEELEDYAAKRNLNITSYPNGTLATSMAFVFMDYFASRTKSKNKWLEINEFFNTNFSKLLDSHKYPNAYLVYLNHKKSNDRIK